MSKAPNLRDCFKEKDFHPYRYDDAEVEREALAALCARKPNDVFIAHRFIAVDLVTDLDEDIFGRRALFNTISGEVLFGHESAHRGHAIGAAVRLVAEGFAINTEIATAAAIFDARVPEVAFTDFARDPVCATGVYASTLATMVLVANVETAAAMLRRVHEPSAPWLDLVTGPTAAIGHAKCMTAQGTITHVWPRGSVMLLPPRPVIRFRRWAGPVENAATRDGHVVSARYSKKLDEHVVVATFDTAPQVDMTGAIRITGCC